MPLIARMEIQSPAWEAERHSLMARKISDFGLSIEGTKVERLVEQLYAELGSRGLNFKPPVYLSDQWGCPDGKERVGIQRRGTAEPD